MNRTIQINPTPRTTALCYIRQSITRDGSDMNSPDRQRANIQRICDEHGWLPEWYQDADGHKSGRSEKNRPEWLALKTRLGDPDVIALVANDTSRLHRKSWRIGDLLDFLQEHKIRLVLAASKQEIDLTGISGMLFAQLAAIFDEWYAADISRRAKDSIAHRKRLGKVAGAIPFGTHRKEDGFLEPSPHGAWWLPDGSFVAGKENHAPDEGALWRSYYDCAKRAFTLYVENKHGIELISYQMNIEGWAFKSREGQPRPINKDDIRRIIRNWPEYGGIVLDKASKKRHARELTFDTLQFIPEHAAMPIDLLQKVAKVNYERAGRARNHGVKKNVRVYALNGITLCSHCEKRAIEHNDPALRSRLIGQVGRYRHKEGLTCSSTNRSVDMQIYEAEFGRLIKLLTVRENVLPLLTEMAIQADKGQYPLTDERDPEAEKREAITLCKRRIDAAVNLYSDGRITREEYLRRVEQNEREISHWEMRTTETQKIALELTMCLSAIDKLVKLWEIGEPEDKQGMVRTLFSSVIFDLDTHRIIDFKLKPWAERFLILRTVLYDINTDDKALEFGSASALEGVIRDVLPGGLRSSSVYTLPDPRYCMFAVIEWAYYGLPVSVPTYYQHLSNDQRNQELVRRYLNGESAATLAREFGISDRRVRFLVQRETNRTKK